MNITIHTVTYNEELLMQLMVDHYRARFPNCHIVVYDNQSTDRTVEIAKANGCEIRHYDSGGQVNDQMLWETKNTCWKNAKTDWVLVCDLDEMLDITEQQLIEEDAQGVTKIKCECYHMVNMEDNLDVRGITHGARDPRDTVYDKDLLFNKKFVDINYINNDCHFTNSKGTIKNSKPYKMFHYKYVNPDLFVNKQKISASRLSEINRKNGWGAQCLRDEGNLRNEFQQARDAAVKILDGRRTEGQDSSKIKHFYQNIQGWFCFPNLYTKMVNELPDGAHVVEVGAWKGSSTAYLAVEIINSGKNIKLDVVDIWTGSENDLTAFNTDTEFMQYNRNIFELFKKNVAPVLHALTPLQMTSVDAAKLYADKSLDFVLIDADHSYEEVKKDILAWLPKIKNGGVIAGDDYNPTSFPGVIKAVHEILPNDKITFCDSCWVVKVEQ
jgi:glycosyltransferase involved in cell wall biosynthesis